MSSSNEKVRYVMAGGVVEFNIMLSEIMVRNNSGRTTPDKMLRTLPVVMHGQLGFRLSHMAPDEDQRMAWITSSKDSMQWLVWLGKDSFATTDHDGQGNLLPKIDKTISVSYLDIKRAFECIELYLLYWNYPIDHMPAGHLQTLTG